MRTKPVRLREVHDAAPNSATVIDAEFAVARGRRGWFAKLLLALVVVGLTALAGMLVPPVVVLTKALLSAD